MAQEIASAAVSTAKGADGRAAKADMLAYDLARSEEERERLSKEVDLYLGVSEGLRRRVHSLEGDNVGYLEKICLLHKQVNELTLAGIQKDHALQHWQSFGERAEQGLLLAAREATLKAYVGQVAACDALYRSVPH